MTIIKEVNESGFIFYLVKDNNEYLFIQTSHQMSIHEITTELLDPESYIISLDYKCTLDEFNKKFYVNFDTLMFENSFKSISNEDYIDFNLYLTEDLIDEDSILKYQCIPIQKAFGMNFIQLFNTKKPPNIPVNHYYISYYQEEEYLFVIFGKLNNKIYNIEAYGFHQSFLNVLFNTYNTVKLDFCTDYLSDDQFCQKVVSFFCNCQFENSNDVDTVLNIYSRIRKITSVLS